MPHMTGSASSYGAQRYPCMLRSLGFSASLLVCGLCINARSCRRICASPVSIG